MDKFKSILRKGLQLQAERISLVLGQPAAFFLGANKADQPEFGVLDQTWILNLFQAPLIVRVPDLRAKIVELENLLNSSK